MKSDLHLNIVSFDVPFPPDYGGVIDVYYKLKSLAEAGIKIHLHTFKYGRQKAIELDALCHEIQYYDRKILPDLKTLNTPYIVASRRSPQLLRNLQSNPYPVIFEGLHCSYYANHPSLLNRVRVIRMHNMEHLYYKHLARVEQNPLKKIYFNIESGLLKSYAKILSTVNYIAAISPSDNHIFDLKYKNSFYLPVFHPNHGVTSINGKGDYILYHGNLGVGENNSAALFLAREVFPRLPYKAIIAGSNPSPKLINAIRQSSNITLFSNISLNKIYNLIKDAHINVLPTFQDTGIKLKLLNALFRGRFCLVNNKMVKDTGLESLCYVANGAESWTQLIHKLMQMPFSEQHINERKKIMDLKFSNSSNCQILIKKIYANTSS